METFFRSNKLSGTSQESCVGGIIKNHVNVSVVSVAVGDWDSCEHCSEFTCNLVYVLLVGWLSILLILNFSRLCLISCSMPMVAIDWLITCAEEKELITTARQQQKESCNEELVIDL